MNEPLMKACLICDGPVIQNLKAHMSKKRFESVRFCSQECWREYDKKHPSGFRKTFIKNALYNPIEENDEDVRVNKIIEEIRDVESRLKIVDEWLTPQETVKRMFQKHN